MTVTVTVTKKTGTWPDKKSPSPCQCPSPQPVPASLSSAPVSAQLCPSAALASPTLSCPCLCAAPASHSNRVLSSALLCPVLGCPLTQSTAAVMSVLCCVQPCPNNECHAIQSVLRVLCFCLVKCPRSCPVLLSKALQSVLQCCASAVAMPGSDWNPPATRNPNAFFFKGEEIVFCNGDDSKVYVKIKQYRQHNMEQIIVEKSN